MVDTLAPIRALSVERVGTTATHAYLEVRLTLQHCDWEQGGCGCAVQQGPGAVRRLIVLDRGAIGGAAPVRGVDVPAEPQITPLEGYL